MTRYILIGGSQEKADQKLLGRAIFNSTPERPVFLVCLFARDPEIWHWQEVFRENVQFFAKMTSGKDIEFVLANEKEFTKQVSKADIIYFAGGDQNPLYKTMGVIGNEWQKHLDGKAIIGTSASTDMLSKYNYDIQYDDLGVGLGLVPVKTIVHYGNKEYEPKIGWEKAVSELEDYKEKIPVVLLREGEFFVYESKPTLPEVDS